jgi:hypothetical protein
VPSKGFDSGLRGVGSGRAGAFGLMYLRLNLAIIVNHFPLLQRTFSGGCRKANPAIEPGDLSTVSGGIDTPFADAYIFCLSF